MQTWKQLSTLDALVVALCRDFMRRQVAICEGFMSKRTLTEYKYLNTGIFEAVSEVVGEFDAKAYIEEIGSMTGYAKSKFAYRMSEGTYKSYKRNITHNIAKKLHLSD